MFNMRRTEAEILFVGTDMNELLLKLDKIKFFGKNKTEKFSVLAARQSYKNEPLRKLLLAF